MSIRHSIARVTGNAATWGLRRLFHREAGNLPGKMALRIDPQFIAHLRGKFSRSVVVVGTNGKTTVTNLIASMLEQSGSSVACNRTGANLAYGVASTLLQAPAHSDWAVLESDELWLAHVLPQVQADYVVLLNLFRDQLDRCGEINHVQDVIIQSLQASPHSVLIYNGDDPQCAFIASRVGNESHAFGIEQHLGLEQNSIADAQMCQACSGMLEYQTRHYGQLGMYQCPSCGFARPAIDIRLDKVSLGLDESRFNIACGDKSWSMGMPFGGAYMVYNVGAACALGMLAGCSRESVQACIDGFHPDNGRLQRMSIRGKDVLLNLAKNPTGFNQNIRLVTQGTKPAAVAFFINDLEADGHDISWLWDTDFEELASRPGLTVFAGGRRAHDMQLRLKHAGVNATIVDGARQVIDFVAARPDLGKAFLIANYTSLPQVKADLEAMAREDAGMTDSEPVPAAMAASMTTTVDADAGASGNAPASDAIIIAHLYPDLLNLYGDGGNVRVLRNRLEWRGIPVQVLAPHHGQSIDLSQVDLVFVGGGPDREQRLAAEDLGAIASELRAFVAQGGPLLAICGGYQMLGKVWLLDDEEVEGLGIFDAQTKRVEGGSTNRLIGNIALQSSMADRPVIGFENHAGRTYLGADAQPFGTIAGKVGNGNNDDSGCDGAITNNAIGTYLHGPLLGKNPQVADHLLACACQRHAARAGQPVYELAPLDDSVELEANAAVARQLHLH